MAKWSPSNTATYYWANGSQVAQNKGAPSIWTDQSGNGRVMQRPSQAAAPSLLTADLNGHDVLEFDGSNDCFESDDNTEFKFESSDFAVFCVHQRTGSGSTPNQGVYNVGNPAFTDGFCAVYTFVSGIFDGFFLTATSTFVQDEVNTTAVFCTALIDNSTGNCFGRVDGATVGNTSAPDTSYDAASKFTIGATSSGQNHFDGKIAELIVIEAALSDREIEQFEGYLLHKYDLDKFPSAHRFRRFTPAVGLHGVHNQDLLGELALDVSGPLVSDTLAGAV